MKKLFNTYYRSKISFWNTISTEWNAIKSDKAVVGTFLSITIILLFVYTYVYSNEVVKEVPVAIVNQDATKTSRDYIAMLDASDGIKAITQYRDVQEAKRAYYSKKVQGVVIIPKDFEKNLRSGKQTSISTYADASNMVFYKKVLGDVTITTGYFNAGIAIKKELAKGVSITKATQNYTPIKGNSISLFNTSSGYATYMIPMLTALIIQLVLLMGIGILNGSRQEIKSIRANFPRLLHFGGTIPVLLAKACLYSTIFALILPIQIGVIYTIFSIPIRSNLFYVLSFLIPYLFSVVFLGIAISSLFKKREESIIFLVLISIPSLMLSGLSFPKEGFSAFYQILSYILPSTPGIKGFVKLTQMQANFSEVYQEWVHLWVLTLIYFSFAAITLKIRAYKELQYSRK
tara:strand:+ start:15135 stop:16343 length:1209 start_codon:yes stop_codon:yes gene_type:complete